jgi:transcription termination factor Rho
MAPGQNDLPSSHAASGHHGKTEHPATACEGLLEIDAKGFGFLRAVSIGITKSPSDAYVGPDFIRRFQLRPGVIVEGTAGVARDKAPSVQTIARVNGLQPDQWMRVKDFSSHEVVSPNEWLRVEGRGHGDAMRVIDLFCPIGRGQRALIVSPPKAGKTILLQQLAHAIGANYPDVDVVVLLVDERPEEVTDMRRTVKGQVFASSSDAERGVQVRLAMVVLEYVKRKVETGRDVVLLLDSLTRLGRAFNIHQKGSGKTLSGGVDARALEIPKRIFGSARKLEEHGSLTIIATALIETNSRMDELIFQEFKGTGNMELVLDRTLADERIFPAICLGLSGTRREELLFGAAVPQHQALRRLIARKTPREAMLGVQKLLTRFPKNEQLLENVSAL